MTPIPTAIIGLSTKAITSWASRAHIPYLLSPEGRAKYRIVALCNSSVEAAESAVAAYGLPSETRTYSSPEDLARDQDVRFVVCCTRVDKHFETVVECVKAGKDAYVEWPLAHNATKASELAQLAKENGGSTVVGLQGWFAPSVVKVKELLSSGRIGKVLSSDVRAAGGSLDRVTLPAGLKYFTERKFGGNPFTIGFGHLFDTVQFVLGDIEDVSSRLQIQRPQAKIKDASTGEIVETIKSDVPDLIHVTGSLPESATTAEGATLHLAFRRGQPFKGEAPLIWTVNGEKGEIRLVAWGGPAIQANSHGEPLTIEVHDHETDEVDEIPWSWTMYEGYPLAARNIGALYDAYAAGNPANYPDFEHALKRHNQLEAILGQFDEKA
ncbi:hypothetical protein BX600DRAFT_16789 [Xylariales sp. PMI_506]|nr:hypothetical protein BX600DRAFT_16789 [Xylariales sp. PMI_506]